MLRPKPATEAWNHGECIGKASPFMAELFRLVKYDTVIYPDKWYLIGIQAYPEETISRPLSW